MSYTRRESDSPHALIHHATSICLKGAVNRTALGSVTDATHLGLADDRIGPSFRRAKDTKVIKGVY